MKTVERVNVRALQAAVVALIGPKGAEVLESLYDTLDNFEAQLHVELDDEAYEAGHREGFKEGYDAAMEAVYGEQPAIPSPVICLPDQTAEHDAEVASAVASLESYYEGDEAAYDEMIANAKSATDWV
jgi:flagellar biosynthesis/type III secretory pathway protein FliH